MFSIIFPPPNVTGSLHLGHALTVSIQDSIARYQRMLGKEVKWFPGLDHAGIATQVVVEKSIHPVTRHELGREKFIEEVWKWKEKYGDNIKNQLCAINASLDWDNLVFTMDDEYKEFVKQAFIKLYDKGIIYRADKEVAWCYALQSTISSTEIEEVEVDKATTLLVGDYFVEVGVEYRYMFGEKVCVKKEDSFKKTTNILDALKDPDSPFGVSSPNPDGFFPKDSIFEGKHRLEVRNLLPDMIKERGYFIEKKELSGKMYIHRCSRTGDLVEYINKPQWWLNCKKVLFETEEESDSDSVPKVPKTSNDKLNSLISMFTKNTSKPKIRKLSMLGEKVMSLIPEDHHAKWKHWIENIQDWCISRQLWWGHEIPMYFKEEDHSEEEEDEDEDEDEDDISDFLDALERAQGSDDEWITHAEYEHRQKTIVDIKQNAINCMMAAFMQSSGGAAAFMQSSGGAADFMQSSEGVSDFMQTEGVADFMQNAQGMSIMAQALGEEAMRHTLALDRYTQDEDVLDTWFSSALLPSYIKKKYGISPTSLMETGGDILFFWVFRMILLYQLLEDTDDLPFEKLYLHNMIRDETGKKMSKSLGNAVDPMDYIYDDKGDALRFGLLTYTNQSTDINLNPNVIKSASHFRTKIKNAAWGYIDKFETNIDKFSTDTNDIINDTNDIINIEDKWISAKLSHLVKEVKSAYDEYRLADAASLLQTFFVDDFCGKYIEYTKRNKTNTTKDILEKTMYIFMSLLYPIMPDISSKYLGLTDTEYITVFPDYESLYSDSLEQLETEVNIKIKKRYLAKRLEINESSIISSLESSIISSLESSNISSLESSNISSLESSNISSLESSLSQEYLIYKFNNFSLYTKPFDNPKELLRLEREESDNSHNITLLRKHLLSVDEYNAGKKKQIEHKITLLQKTNNKLLKIKNKTEKHMNLIDKNNQEIEKYTKMIE